MAITKSTFSRDGNSVPIMIDGIVATKSMTFAGGTTNDPGDYDGTGNPATLFTVTGTVKAIVFATCETDLAGASATVEAGITGNTASLLPWTTATTVDQYTIWTDTGPSTCESLPSAKILTNGADIIQTVRTANITAGAITYYCVWTPLSEDGDVTAA